MIVLHYIIDNRAISMITSNISIIMAQCSNTKFYNTRSFVDNKAKGILPAEHIRESCASE